MHDRLQARRTPTQPLESELQSQRHPAPQPPNPEPSSMNASSEAFSSVNYPPPSSREDRRQHNTTSVHKTRFPLPSLPHHQDTPAPAVSPAPKQGRSKRPSATHKQINTHRSTRAWPSRERGGSTRRDSSRLKVAPNRYAAAGWKWRHASVRASTSSVIGCSCESSKPVLDTGIFACSTRCARPSGPTLGRGASRRRPSAHSRRRSS